MTRVARTRTKIAAELAHARGSLRPLRIFRKSADGGPYDAFVLSLGSRWVLLQPITQRLDLDGYACLRIQDLASVEHYPQAELLSTVFRARRIRPRRRPIDLSSTPQLLASAQRMAGLLVIERNTRYPGEVEVGHIVEFKRAACKILTVSIHVEIDGEEEIRFADVTAVSFENGYEEGLNVIAKFEKRSRPRSAT